jgi:hypothetical protein
VTPCTGQIDVFVSRRNLRFLDDASTKARRRIRFAFGVVNVPPGQTVDVNLPLTRRGEQIRRTNKRPRLRGVMEIRNLTGTAIVSNTPVVLRLRRR